MNHPPVSRSDHSAGIGDQFTDTRCGAISTSNSNSKWSPTYATWKLKKQFNSLLRIDIFFKEKVEELENTFEI